MTQVDAAEFRRLCARFATGVMVVTATDEGENPIGMTANSFASVSLEPPLVSVNIYHQAELHGSLVGTTRFGLNVLANGQEFLSRQFAGPREDRFRDVGYRLSPGGNPWLEGALASFDCIRYASFEAGDHTILVGSVKGGTVGPGEPLVFYDGRYFGGIA